MNDHRKRIDNDKTATEEVLQSIIYLIDNDLEYFTVNLQTVLGRLLNISYSAGDHTTDMQKIRHSVHKIIIPKNKSLNDTFDLVYDTYINDRVHFQNDAVNALHELTLADVVVDSAGLNFLMPLLVDGNTTFKI
jgi:hypothetical protein